MSLMVRILLSRWHRQIHGFSTASIESVTLTDSKPPPVSFPKYVCSQYSRRIKYLNKLLDSYEQRRVRVHKKLLADRQPLIQTIEKHICTPRVRLVPVGSMANGLVLDQSSDIDLCFYTDDPTFYDDIASDYDFRHYFFDQLEHLTRELVSVDSVFAIDDIKTLSKAVVPLQIAFFRSGFAVDIHVPLFNFQGIRNTNLVKHYVLADPRLPMVYFYFKRLFEALGLRNSKGGLLSSYHLTMLTVHFLQSRALHEPVLPVLCKTHPQYVGPELEISKVLSLTYGDIDPVVLGWRSRNSMSAGELVVEMVNYYKAFNPSNTEIFIHRGLAVKRRILGNAGCKLLLYDPYASKSICGSEYIPDAFKTAFDFIYRKMRSGMLMDSFPNFPEAAQFRSYAEWKPWFSKLKCR